MKTHPCIVPLFILCVAVFHARATLAADTPDTAPPATFPLADGKIHFTPPPADGWENAPQANNRLAAFTTKEHDGILAIQLLPPEMDINPATTDAIVRQLKQSRQKSNARMELPPTVESDDRFALKIHERYEAVGKDGAASGKLADQLHLYRYVGRSLLMATVNTVSDDPDVVKATQTAGEDALLSATAPGAKNPPARKAATKPSTRPTTKPTTRPIKP